MSELHSAHDMALPTFLRHLNVLENSGLTKSKKNGRVRTVSICADQLKPLDKWLDQQRDNWSGRLDRLAQFAQDLERTKS